MPVIILTLGKNSKSILFSFIPKTGGTSIIKFFREIGSKIYLHNENNNIVGLLRCPSQHFHYKILNEIYDLNKFDVSFNIVRNPFEKIKSDYLWSYRNIKEQSKIVNFDEWFDYMINNYQKNNFFFDNHIRPQSHFHGEKIKSVYKFENGLDNVIKDLFGQLNLQIKSGSKKPLITKENSSENFKLKMAKSDIRVSDKTIDKIKIFYKSDFINWYPIIDD